MYINTQKHFLFSETWHQNRLHGIPSHAAYVASVA